MKIAIFHNLQKGGALNYINKIIKYLSLHNSIDIYSFHGTNNVNKNVKEFTFPIKKTKNIFQHMYQIATELKHKNKIIARKINSAKKYDLALVFPCIITQSPYILRYINYQNTKTIYMFMETKREFYENTTYDHWSIKRTLARIIRHPIKLIDKKNCKMAENIISLSYFSSDQIKNIYQKKSYTISPAIKNIKPKKIIKKNNQKFISVGLLSKIKGHDFSIHQTNINKCNLLIIGRTSQHETMPKKSNNTKIMHTENNKKMKKLIKKSTYYLANQINEPFGISTLEACNLNTYILGKNEGGTPEIVRHGLNGFLYPNNLSLATKVTKKYKGIKQLKFQKTCKISWKKTAQDILTLYHHLKNEPTE